MNTFEFLKEKGRVIKKQKGDHIFRQGDQNRNMYVVIKGLMKAYYLTPDGKENVKTFLKETNFIGSISACFSNTECTFNLMCLEDSELLEVGFDAVDTETKSDLHTAQFMIQGLLGLASKKEQREYEFLCLSAEERFRLFIDREPNLTERLTQNDIARYLGVTPVALSRIRKRINSPDEVDY